MRRPASSALALLAVLVALAVPASAPAGTGGASPGEPAPAPDPGPAPAPEASPPSAETEHSGGARAGQPTKRRAPRRRRPAPRDGGRPVLRTFTVAPGRAYLFGAPPRVVFAVSDRSATVAAAVEVLRPGTSRVLKRVDLGRRRTGVRHRIALGLSGLPEGPLRLRIAARDPGGSRLRAGAAGVRTLEVRGHRMPVVGAFTYGGPDARFGRPRPGHRHQGQDLPAAEGTPLVAPRGGVVKVAGYEAGGAGYHVVLDGAEEDRNYVFMHMQAGSVRVRPGQRVQTGQRIGNVGNTGASFGAHLHFEIWSGGPWRAGGRPVDPYPLLRAWDRWS